MTSKALVAMTPPSEYMNILTELTAQLPSLPKCCSHNRLHGQLLQIKAVLQRALCSVRWDFIEAVDTFTGSCQALTPLCASSQCPFSWTVWGTKQDGCLAVAGDWGSVLPPGESSLSWNSRITEKSLLRNIPVQAQWNTRACTSDASRGAPGRGHALFVTDM